MTDFFQTDPYNPNATSVGFLYVNRKYEIILKTNDMCVCVCVCARACACMCVSVYSIIGVFCAYLF